MIPEGWDIKRANAELQKIKKAALEHYAGKAHTTADIDDYVAEKWHKLCGLTFEKPEPVVPQTPPPPKMVEVTGPRMTERSERKRTMGDL